ncbi:hypothetical protein G6O69_26585 [Pseudenhygromyxa sp. WMMC2535]|uniref:hypothetical protein n=1 Tax=Pseudenhygromyxa sp. WMMC2535 TaxID=2712867 RepID=UPI001557DF7D|nr:hypothetical protein [Pseudenhygromyxa sp. WMMC2535]NVB41434.1 hypothetical protein [Pseudenhygromyxa sp. WMMC2535]
MKRSTCAPLVFLLGMSLQFGCKPPENTDDPDLSNEESLVGSREYSDYDEEGALDESYGKREELPPLADPVEKCTGKGKNKECKMVDPQPEVTAAYGARKLIGRFRWGMDVRTVMGQLEKDIEDEYAELQAKTKDPNEQDRNREWKREQIAEIAKNHVRFEEAAHHRWGVSLIAHEFVDNEGEEMVWVKSPTLKKFFFFKDGELYKIVYAYGLQSWEGMDYKQVLDQKFKKWFGASPESKMIVDEETQIKLADYVQWNTADNDRVRAFDMSAVHGAYVISVVDGDAEERYGERLPTRKDDGEFTDSVSDVLGGSDICYDEEGNMIEDADRCNELRGELEE